MENLLSITRMENGQVNLRIQPELIQDIFDDVLAHLDHDAARHTIVTNVADDLLMADMDAQLIEQVLVNLINNAIKYTPEHSRIELFAAPEGKFVRICVTDDGPGIPEESRDKLFDMFLYTVVLIIAGLYPWQNPQRWPPRAGSWAGLVPFHCCRPWRCDRCTERCTARCLLPFYTPAN